MGNIAVNALAGKLKRVPSRIVKREKQGCGL